MTALCLMIIPGVAICKFFEFKRNPWRRNIPNEFVRCFLNRSFINKKVFKKISNLFDYVLIFSGTNCQSNCEAQSTLGTPGYPSSWGMEDLQVTTGTILQHYWQTYVPFHSQAASTSGALYFICNPGLPKHVFGESGATNGTGNTAS